MRRSPAALALLPLLAAACMSGSSPPETASLAALPAAGPPAPFAELRVLASPALDYVDPALAYSTESWALLWNVHVPLVTYAHAEGRAGARIVPALAEQLPEISDDGLAYRFHLRPGLRYSDGEPVRAGDFERAVERLREMASPGALLFAALAEVETDDGERIVDYRLTAPQGDFLHVLATPFAAPVPKGTKPVEQIVPATGPYRIAEHDVGRRVVLARNDRFLPSPQMQAGNARRIVVRVVPDGAAAARLVRRGDADYSFVAPRGATGEGVRLSAAPSTTFYFLNAQAPPFDRPELRRAVAYAIDREHLAGLGEGPAVAAQELLPPGVPGHARLDLYPRDLERARALVRAADADGARVAVWGSTAPESRAAARHLASVLRELGLRASHRELPVDDYLLRAATARRMQAGVASWVGTGAHPLAWYRALLHGDRTGDRVSTNLARADLPELNERIDELARQPLLTPDVAARWAELERWAMEQAFVVPFRHNRRVELFGPRVDVRGCWRDHVVYRIDLARLCLAAETPS